MRGPGRVACFRGPPSPKEPRRGGPRKHGTRSFFPAKGALMLNLLRSCVLSLAAAVPVAAADWPAWRGPDGQGHSSEKNLPLHWSATDNVRWKVKLPDEGNSTPVVWGNRVFVTQASEKVD